MSTLTSLEAMLIVEAASERLDGMHRDKHCSVQCQFAVSTTLEYLPLSSMPAGSDGRLFPNCS